MINYSDVIGRLIAYRNKLGKTQKQLGELLNICQEQYSNLENENTIISDDNLSLLRENGCDINFLLTGKNSRYDSRDLDDVLDDISDQAAKDFLLKQLADYLVYNICKINKYKMVRGKDIQLLEALTKSWDDFSMIRFVYNSLGISQTEMAQKLGIGIKKCRKLEYYQAYPDAELIVMLYDISGCSPILFTNINNRKELIIRAVWKSLRSKEREKAMEYITTLKRFI